MGGVMEEGVCVEGDRGWEGMWRGDRGWEGNMEGG